MEANIIQILVNGGLASVALVSIYLNFKTTTNHINHSTEVLEKLNETLGELKQVISDKIK